MRPRVDVGVVTWNTSDLTVQCLRRLLDADQGADIRLLVFDNGSEDGTPEAVRAKVPEAELEVSPVNLGFAAGMNRLLARSDAPWFFALNSDAWPEPGAIRRLVQRAVEHPRAAVVAPLLLRPDGTLEHSTYPFPSLRVSAVLATGAYRLMSRRRLSGMLLERYWQHDQPRLVDWAVGAAWLMRRAAVDQIGGFDESFFMYVEDVEWCWRAHRAGWEVRFDPTAVVRHVGNASGKQRFRGARTREYLRNTNVFYQREHGQLASRCYRVLNAAAALRWYLVFRLRGDRGTATEWLGQARAHLGR